LVDKFRTLPERAQRLILQLYDSNKEVVKTSLLPVVPNSYSLERYLRELQKDGLINIREEKIVRKTFYVSLTPKGRAVAEQIRRISEVGDLSIQVTPEEVEKSKNLRFLFHVNVLDDHVTVEETAPGRPPRVFNIYVKLNGGGNFRLWCEEDDSFDCWHVRTAWGYPQVQKIMMHYRGKIKVCHVCGYENPENANYCMKCGARLE